MARMIPAVIRDDAPSSEKRIFERLRAEPGTEDWTVLHSVGLWSTYTGAYGEIDFLALVPGIGVVCIEVKGGAVHCREGIWWTTPEGGSAQQLKRSPFEQVKAAMWKLLDATRKKFGEQSSESKCPFGWIVIFPSTSCPPPGTEFSRNDVIDMHDLRGEIASRIKAAPSVVAAARNRRPPSASTIRNLLNFLRPDFERVPTAGSSIGPVVEHLNALTEEQYGILDSIVENKCSIVQGYAGTGKTTLAVELARRATANKQSVLLLCFNRLLGDWLQHRVSRFGPGTIVTGAVHQLLRERILRSSFSGEFRALNPDGSGYWNEKYYLFGVLSVAELAEKFDLVVIDEAQDFQMSNLLVLAKEWLADVGKLVLFGDFARQAIYNVAGNPLEEARTALESPAMFRLHKNCRNTKRIAECTANVCALDAPGYHDRLPEGVPVTVHYYRDAAGLRRTLNDSIKALQADGIAREDLVVLGRYQLEKSSLANANGNDLGALPKGALQLRGGLVYHTIHSFKGMESAVVLVVDIDDLDAAEMESLLYVGISRAKVILHVFINEHCRTSLERRLGGYTGVRIVST